MDKKDKIKCSFCGKNSDEVNKLIEGASVYICDSCVYLCQEILEEDTTHKHPKKKISSTLISNKELKQYMDDYIVGHDKAKKLLIVSIINHFKRINQIQDDVEIEKENIIMIGSSGTGKTALVKTISKKLNIPFAMCDSTVLSEVGYVGADPDSIIKRLVKEANYDISKAETGIIFIDEIDKKAKKSLSGNGKDASGEGVQQALLKLIEGTIVDIEVPKKSETVKLDTSNILFIVAGAFSGIDKIVKNRTHNNKIGFHSKEVSDEEKTIKPEDIISYGIIPELIGRLPIIIKLEELTKEQLRSILLDTKNSIIKQYIKLFAIDDLVLEFDDSSIDYIVNKSYDNMTGVRGMRNIIEDKLMDIMFDIPDIKSSNYNKITITSNFFSLGEKPIYSNLNKTY